MAVKPKRVTQLTVMADTNAAMARYEALGFAEVESGDDQCVGYLAGKTGVLVVTTAFFASEFGADLAARMEGETFPYIYLESVDDALANLPAGHEVIKDVVLTHGTREVLVRDQAGFMLLAEMTRKE